VDASIVTTQFTCAAIFVYGMQKLKTAPWFPLLQHNGQVWIKRGASIIAAGFVHLGIGKVWNPGVIAGAGVLTITFPGWLPMLIGFWHWLGQYAMQEVMYQTVSNRVSITTDGAGSIPARIAPGGAVVIPEAIK
jgi:hypothetical protein